MSQVNLPKSPQTSLNIKEIAINSIWVEIKNSQYYLVFDIVDKDNSDEVSFEAIEFITTLANRIGFNYSQQLKLLNHSLRDPFYLLSFTSEINSLVRERVVPDVPFDVGELLLKAYMGSGN